MQRQPDANMRRVFGQEHLRNKTPRSEIEHRGDVAGHHRLLRGLLPVVVQLQRLVQHDPNERLQVDEHSDVSQILRQLQLQIRRNFSGVFIFY